LKHPLTPSAGISLQQIDAGNRNRSARRHRSPPAAFPLLGWTKSTLPTKLPRSPTSSAPRLIFPRRRWSPGGRRRRTPVRRRRKFLPAGEAFSPTHLWPSDAHRTAQIRSHNRRGTK
jgi:hypothetical protein